CQRPAARANRRQMRFSSPTAGPRSLPVGFDDASENLALPVRFVDGPALHGPAVVLDDPGTAVVMDVPLALLLRPLELFANPPGIAAPAVDVVIVDDRDDARLA